MGKLQNEDFKTEAELTGAGGTASQLLNDTKIYVTANAINKTLDDAITDGDIGSGGGGGPSNIEISTSSGVQNITSASFVDVTNLSVTITTTGKPVVLMLVADGDTTSGNEGEIRIRNSSGNTATGHVAFLRASTIISQQTYEVSDSGLTDVYEGIPCSSFHHIDPVAAGTYTYKVQALKAAGTAIDFEYIKLVAYELNTGSGTAVNSQLRLDGYNGAGSTNTEVMRFTTVTFDESNGDMTLSQSASLGDSITINQDGLYTIDFRLNNSLAGQVFGVMRSSTTGLAQTASNAIVYIESIVNNVNSSGSATRRLNATDVLRATNYASGGTPNNMMITVTRIG